MSKKYRKVLAAILAATMVLGSGIVANAEEKQAKGTGSLDAPETKEVFSVVLPTSGSEQFNYILDPTGVIAETNFAKYGGTASASFVPGKTMYFKNKLASGSNIATYSDVSDPITAYNKSNFDVEINVKATIATPSGIVLSNTPVATASTATPSMYIAVKASGSAPQAITAGRGVVATSSIASASDCYVATYSDAKYSYVLDATTSQLKPTDATFGDYFESYSFMLTGDCNKAGEWIGLTETPPTVSLVWTIDNPTGPTEVDVAAISIASGTVSVRLVSGQNAVKSKITSVKVDGTATTRYDVASSGAVTVSGVSGAGSHTIVIVYDGTTYKGTITVR